MHQPNGNGDRLHDRRASRAFKVVTPPTFTCLSTAHHPIDWYRPYLHQLDAWDRMDAHLEESQVTGIFEGMVVLPTGAGKTLTAVHWLLRHVVNQGGRVLWLAHRHKLLEQAAAAFTGLVGLANRRDTVRVRMVSGVHCGASQIEPDDDVIIASVPSLTRRPKIVASLLRGGRTFLVVDEAHHSTAKTYRKIIAAARKVKPRRVLGLTATPTRTDPKERPLLSHLFGGRVIYRIGAVELTERGILARPVPERVQTYAEVEVEITPEDLEHLARFGDLSEEWLDRIARMAGRNRVIIDRYLESRGRYGKTLVFAINVAHAAFLTDQLRAAGVGADYIAYRRGDGRSNREILDRFRDPAGGLDVLVNVMILTEGVDLPEVQTVLLTRPTSSEILVRQMVGRALRGPAAGGTERAYLVSFEDHWSRHRDWRSPLDLFPDVTEPVIPADEGKKAQSDPEEVPWGLLRDIAEWLQRLPREPRAKAASFEAVPDGCFVVHVQEGDDLSSPRIIPVYAHQLPWWEALMDTLASAPRSGLENLDERAITAHFSGPGIPPSSHDLGQVLKHFRLAGARPRYHVLAERHECDPRELARLILDGDLGERARTDLLAARYTELARAVFSSPRDFRAAVEDALHELQNVPSPLLGR